MKIIMFKVEVDQFVSQLNSNLQKKEITASECINSYGALSIPTAAELGGLQAFLS